MVAGPQWRFFPRRPTAPGAAPGDGPVVRLPDGQRRGTKPRPALAAQLDPAHAGGAQAAEGFRPWHAAHAEPQQPAHPGLHSRIHRCRWQHRGHPVRSQRFPRRPGGRTGIVTVRRQSTGGDARRQCVPADRSAAVPADFATLWLLLVPAGFARSYAQLARPAHRGVTRIDYPGIAQTHGRTAGGACQRHPANQHPAPVPAETALVRGQGRAHRPGTAVLWRAFRHRHYAGITQRARSAQ